MITGLKPRRMGLLTNDTLSLKDLNLSALCLKVKMRDSRKKTGLSKGWCPENMQELMHLLHHESPPPANKILRTLVYERAFIARERRCRGHMLGGFVSFGVPALPFYHLFPTNLDLRGE